MNELVTFSYSVSFTRSVECRYLLQVLHWAAVHSWNFQGSSKVLLETRFCSQTVSAQFWAIRIHDLRYTVIQLRCMMHYYDILQCSSMIFNGLQWSQLPSRGSLNIGWLTASDCEDVKWQSFNTTDNLTSRLQLSIMFSKLFPMTMSVRDLDGRQTVCRSIGEPWLIWQ